jgi:hypothetical protein
MKNQYFGDINDYRKYGLIRAILQASGVRMLLAWMLTPDDGSTDGKFVSYLQNPGKWARYDPFLFNGLQALLVDECKREVRLIEKADLLSDAEYFSGLVPDSAAGRKDWFESLLGTAEKMEFIFLDPDNGLEVKSKPYGSKDSSKYLYWQEVEALWEAGKSVLIYQHFIRENRDVFVRRMLKQLKEFTPESSVEAFSTPHVVFLMALQPRHLHFHKAIMDTLQRSWEGEIHHRGLASPQHAAKPTAARRFHPDQQ